MSRQGNKVPSQLFETTGGDKLKLNADGGIDIEKPTWSGSPSELGGIQIRGRGVHDVKQMLRSVKKKHPEVNVTEALKKARPEASYRDDMIKIELSFGGPSTGRSIVKSALALAVESGIPAKFCVEATDYMKNEESEACFGYFYERDLIMNRPDGIPLHCVSIKGCKKNQQVIGYVEYFGFRRMVICLASSYGGDDISNTYAIDPMTGKELNLSVDLNLSKIEAQEAYDNKMTPDNSEMEAFSKVIPTGMDANLEKAIDHVSNEAIKYALENCGVTEGEKLLPEHVDKMTSLAMEKLLPFIDHKLSTRKKNKK